MPVGSGAGCGQPYRARRRLDSEKISASHTAETRPTAPDRTGRAGAGSVRPDQTSVGWRMRLSAAGENLPGGPDRTGGAGAAEPGAAESEGGCAGYRLGRECRARDKRKTAAGPRLPALVDSTAVLCYRSIARPGLPVGGIGLSWPRPPAGPGCLGSSRRRALGPHASGLRDVCACADVGPQSETAGRVVAGVSGGRCISSRLRARIV